MNGVRSALILATDTYADPGLTALRAPGQDATELAEVLGDPRIGGFDVRTVINQPAHEITRAVAGFFAERRADDLLLLHVSCHGVKDDSGELYFAATDTALNLLEATAVSSSFVNRMMDRTRAGRVLLLLDCCYSGAFARGMTARAAGAVDVNERLGGRGRAVITASSALQFAFEGQTLTDGDLDAIRPSIFTNALVEGLRTGDADRDLDGWISLDELYAWVHDEVTRVAPTQTPKKWTFDVTGDLYVARRAGEVTTPAELPPELRDSLESQFHWERQGVIGPLTELVRGPHPGRALAGRLALERLTRDDSDQVKAAAREALAQAGLAEPDPAEPDDAAGDVIDDVAEAEAAEEAADTAPTPPDPPTEHVGQTGGVPEEAPPGSSHGGSETQRPRWIPVAAVAAVLAVVLLGWRLVDLGPDRPTVDDSDTTSATTNPTDAGDESTSDDGGEVGYDGVPRGAPLADSEVLVATDAGTDQGELLAVDAASGARRSILRLLAVDRPSPSPDRQTIAYVKVQADGGRVPYLVAADGSGAPRRLLDDEAAEDCPYTGRAAWSTDGSQLAVVCMLANDTSTKLMIVGVDGSWIRDLVVSTSILGNVAWTGDDHILFSLGAHSDGGGTETPVILEGSGGPYVLYRVGVFGGPIAELMPDATTPMVHVDWTEDGTALGGITYVGKSPGDVWLLRGGDGGAPEQITHRGDVLAAAVSPDGEHVAFTTGDGDGATGLWVASADGEASQILSGDLGQPSWGTR